MTQSSNETGTVPRWWFQGVSRYAWMVLIVCALGWLFDTMDQHLFTLVRGPSLNEILKAKVPAEELDATVKNVGGWLTAVFLLGWAAGGFLFGMIGDRLGRTRTMVLTILMYAAFTGLNALVQAPWQYALCRFFTAMGVGGEFAAGAALVAEVWPERSRTMALGTLQALSAVGNMTAAVITLVLSAYSWRYVFVVGAVPALLVVWIRRSVREPEKWLHAKEVAREGRAGTEVGSIRALFSTKMLSRNTIAGVLLGTAGVGGVWGVGFFLPDLLGSVMKPVYAAAPNILALPEADRAAAVTTAVQALKSKVFFVQQIGAFIGMFGYAALSQRIGRKPALALVLGLAFVAVQGAFWGVRDPLSAYLLAFPMGVFCLAPFSAYAVYFPELYPTRLRATGVGFCYNSARILAAGAPFLLGQLSRHFADPMDETMGIRKAATIVAFVYFVGFAGLLFAPETKGKPLPE
ncbi:MAG: MFS transporter [Chthonomonadales bacterium]|nr:MFS transporter [Chthonomonadales bacterium]